MKKNVKITIIDYDNGNLESVYRACDYVGMIPEISSSKSGIKNSDAIILPGVGAFGDAMKSLKDRDLIDPIHNFIKTGKIVVGICFWRRKWFDKIKDGFSQHALERYGLLGGH